jgi:hypothetical protein
MADPKRETPKNEQKLPKRLMERKLKELPR